MILTDKKKLTVKQQRFADFFIESGNAAEAARLAGYSVKTARAVGAENLTKPNITEYIQERIDSQNKENAATADEVIAFFSSVMRGKHGANVSERISAGRELMKRFERLEGGLPLPSQAFEVMETLRNLKLGKESDKNE